ncbi:MAG: toxin-activating lysine-acyltransferase [Hyphomicrobiaceae bacterium]|nr:toxin-activating lysine-acyltransferase [Hyphomicrobiaceae bacterium]
MFDLFKSKTVADAAAAQPVNAGLPVTAEPLPANFREQVMAAQNASAVLGDFVLLLSRVAPYSSMPLQAIPAMVGPAVASGQFAVLHQQDRTSGRVSPVAVALWASLSDELDRTMMQPEGAVSMSESDWTSGPHKWIVEAVGSSAEAIETMLQRLSQKELAGQIVKRRMPGSDGRWVVASVRPG